MSYQLTIELQRVGVFPQKNGLLGIFKKAVYNAVKPRRLSRLGESS